MIGKQYTDAIFLLLGLFGLVWFGVLRSVYATRGLIRPKVYLI